MTGKAQALCQRCGKDRSGKASGLAWTRGTACACARRPPIGTFQGIVGRMASSFSSFIQKESVVASNEVLPNPFVSAETLKADQVAVSVVIWETCGGTAVL